eukprot:TRINITY_DN1902_c0_g2_i2.p1 TRINITY_DN1902_c0_g2~~TRINITY_DN1902_c0_g2_i2.p1  ORF type:complete len:313 (+),score=72.26 TRINITY_DN1902_c0_g2_i2:773-1711(+)
MGPTKEGRYRIKVIDFGTAQSFKKDSKLKSALGTPYYIAPEVLLRNYDERCDVWSCGVILYILLSGTVPFYGETDGEILAAVKRATFSFYSPVWEHISTEAKELVTKMLAFPPSRRITAHKAYTHRWITKRKFNKLNPETATTLLNNLKTFQSQHKLQQAALMYIVTNFLGKSEREELQQTFMALDKNADGKLSREELIDGYTEMYGSAEEAEKEVNAIMKNVDVDHNGYIDYSGSLFELLIEFLIASINKKKILSAENMRRAFQLFDKVGVRVRVGRERDDIGGRSEDDTGIWTEVFGERVGRHNKGSRPE